MSNFTYDTPVGELYHAGVKGMKWGVRKDRKTSSGVGRGASRSTETGAGAKKSTSSSNQPRIKVTKTRRGAKVVAKYDDTKVKIIISNTAAVTSGALRVAAAFVPGAQALSGVATVTSLVGTLAALK